MYSGLYLFLLVSKKKVVSISHSTPCSETWSQKTPTIWSQGGKGGADFISDPIQYSLPGDFRNNFSNTIRSVDRRTHSLWKLTSYTSPCRSFSNLFLKRGSSELCSLYFQWASLWVFKNAHVTVTKSINIDGIKWCFSDFSTLIGSIQCPVILYKDILRRYGPTKR